MRNVAGWVAGWGDPRIEGALRRALPLVALACALIIAGLMFRAMFAVYIPMPFWDQWDHFATRDHWARLFEQHNEHRLVLFRLIAIVDNLLASGTYVVQFAATVGLQLAHVLLLAVLAARAGLRAPGDRLWALAIAFGYLFWRVQEENFLWGFQSQFVGVYICASAGFAALALVPGWAGVVLGALGAALAAGFMSNGVMAPAMLVVQAVWLRRPPVQVLALVLVAGALPVAYFTGYYMPRHHADPIQSLQRPLELIGYVAAYLGHPVAVMLRGGETLSVLMGLVGLTALTVVFVALIIRRNLATPARLALLHIAGFTVATALLTGLGRLNFGLEQALSSRYATPAMVFWTALDFLVWSLLAGGRWRLLVPLAATGALILMAINSRSAVDGTIRSWRELRDGAATAMLSDVRDEPVLGKVYFNPKHLPEKIAMLKAERLAVFAEPWAHWLGRTLAEHVSVLPEGTCRGNFERADPVVEEAGGEGAAYRVSGWGWDEAEARAPRWLVLTDTSGRIVGYAYTDLARPDVRKAIPTITDPDTGWRGHMRLTAPGAATAYAIDPEAGTACRVGTRKVP